MACLVDSVKDVWATGPDSSQGVDVGASRRG
jgi:hypothetical protein